MIKYDLEQIYPGLSVSAEESPGEYYCEYDSPHMLPCPKCGFAGQRAGFTDDDRTVYDIVSDDPPKIVTLHIRRRRHICPDCGCEIPYDPEFAEKRHKSTRRLDNWIAVKSLSLSPAKVSELIDGRLSGTQISRIFDRWSSDKLNNYADQLILPDHLGIHFGLSFRDWYIVLSNLQTGELIDVLAENDVNWMRRLSDLSLLHLPQDCITSIAYPCIVPSRAILGSAGTSLYASLASIVTELQRNYLECVKRICDDKTTDIFRIHLFKLPRSEAISGDTEIRDNAKRVKTVKNNYEISQCDVQWTIVKARVQKGLTKADFDQMTSNLESVQPLMSYGKQLKYARPEIYASIDKPLQNAYDSISRKVDTILHRCIKCSPETLRARIILSTTPNTVPVTIGGRTRYYISGVSLDALIDTLSDYD